MGQVVAVVGATGAVGREMLRVLEQRRYPVASIRMIASSRSAGSEIEFAGGRHRVEPLESTDFKGVDLALFSTGAELALEHGPRAAAAGALVVDNSTAFRMDPDTPLVVPEVNGAELRRNPRIVANPNCCAIPLVQVLDSLRGITPLRRVVVSTYQSVSGTGKEAMEELREQTRASLEGVSLPPVVYPRPIAFNCFPHVDQFLPDGSTREETKVVEESRKILGLPGLRLAVTCVRVPVFRGHSESVNVEGEGPISPEAARRTLAATPGLSVVDDPSRNLYPTALDADGGDLTLVGRIREDVSLPGALNLWLVSDNLRKGAALNAVQIAECAFGL